MIPPHLRQSAPAPATVLAPFAHRLPLSAPGAVRAAENVTGPRMIIDQHAEYQYASQVPPASESPVKDAHDRRTGHAGSSRPPLPADCRRGVSGRGRDGGL